MRIPILLASAASLALTACGNNGAPSNNAASGEAAGMQISDKDLQDQVIGALADAPKHGLTKDLFLKGELPSDQAQRRQLLMKVARDYASALAVGKVDPTKIRDVYTVPRPKVDLGPALMRALSQKKYGEWVNSLAPQTSEYRALSQAFVHLVQRSPDLPDTEIPGGKALKPGASDPRIPAIAANLRAQGYLPAAGEDDQASGDQSKEPATASPPDRYTPQIVAAVKQWQADSGLKPDGIIGSDTIQALNSSPRDRARTLAVAMERLRWLDRNPPATRIDVNTGAAYLDYWRDGRHQDRRKAIVGQPGWETPQLGAPIFQLVANPTWTVPKSIEEEELAEKSQSWLSENNFVRKNGRWVQQSGPKNSLGVVKFDMKDDQAIYLHDTPAKALFQQEDRHDSHGCVRVQGALDFARTIASADGVLDKFNRAMATGDETFVDLNANIPVRLMYHTAYLGDDGRVHFVQDVYAWDDDVATALGYERRVRKAQPQRKGDIGP